MQQISQNSITHIIKEKFPCALTRLWQMHTLRIKNFNLTIFKQSFEQSHFGRFEEEVPNNTTTFKGNRSFEGA